MSADELSKLDPQGALQDVLATSEQWEGAANLDVNVALHPDVQAVLVVGMGGSGIAGDVAGAVGASSLGVPVIVHKGYGVPAWVSSRTLVIAASHSGETEETIDAVTAAESRGARLAAVTSGGQIGEFVDSRGPVASIPAGGQPRHNIGWLAGGVLRLLGLHDGLGGAVTVTRRLADELGPQVPAEDNPARRIAERISAGGTTLIWGSPGLAGVAGYRLACQLNENAELPAWMQWLPELDHNAVVGWQHDASAVGLGGLVVVRDDAEHDRIDVRVSATMPAVRPRVAWVVELVSQGEHSLARMASLIIKADLISIYTALGLGRDPTPIAAIQQLKKELTARK